MSDLDRVLHRAPDRSDAATHGQLTVFVRRLALLGAVVVSCCAPGAVGLALSEHVDLWYAFRWALDTSATVGGFHQPRYDGRADRRRALMVLGVGTLFYALATVTEFFVAGHVGDLLATRRMQRMIDSLTDHHIICGYGRVGRQVARDLQAPRRRYVVIDADKRNRSRAEGLGIASSRATPPMT